MKHNEIWKDVPEYEGLYEVSNLGRIRSLTYNGGKRAKPYMMNPHIQKNGYAYVTLSKDKVVKAVRFHRLVASVFIPNPNNYPVINHIDENKANNNINNLEWCSYKYNANYGNRIAKIVSKNRKAVGKYDENGVLLKKYKGIHEASRAEGISAGNICMSCKGERTKAGGYKWGYINE